MIRGGGPAEQYLLSFGDLAVKKRSASLEVDGFEEAWGSEQEWVGESGESVCLEHSKPADGRLTEGSINYLVK